jgi:hypothetical protein
MEAAADALARYESQTGRKLPNHVVITVIVGGKSLLIWDAKEQNSKQPTFRHVGQSVRKWMTG